MAASRTGLVVIALVAAVLLAPPTRASLARSTDGASATRTIATDTLDPPTALTATGGPTASLAWTATPDPYAAGYDVQRGSVSGGPYTVVASVTPRTTVSASDTPPASGTYYYVLRSAFQGWTSVNSNQASAAVTLAPTATGYRTCTSSSTAADTGGDGNGYESVPANVCADDALSATDANSGTNTTISCTNAGKDRHRFWDFGLGVPAIVASVNGIQVRLDAGMNNGNGTNQICAELSWDGGATWTTPKTQALTGGAAVTTYTLGSASDTWGRTWTGGNLANAAFRLRITDVTSQTNKSFVLEYVAVQVTYRP